MSQLLDEVVTEIEALPEDLQSRVLEYARRLRAIPRGTSGRKMLRFAGLIERDDLDCMSEAIETECEKIHASEW